MRETVQVAVAGSLDGMPTGARAVLAVLAGFVVVVLALAAASTVAAPAATDSGGLAVEEVADQKGLTYAFEGHQVVNGNAGAYVSDYDRDGWPDVLLVGNESRGPVLFENTGNGFEPSGDLPDAVQQRRVHSVLFLDYDNDGWEDLLVLPDPQRPSGGYTATTGPPSLTINTTHPLVLTNRGGTFGPPRALENVSLRPYPVGATAGDVTGDGCVDVYIYQNGDWATRTPVGYRNPSTVGNISDDNGVRNILLAGDCTGHFTNVSGQADIGGERWSLAASIVDLNGDSHLDMHVANDFNRDTIYLNRGNGTFRTRRINGTDRNGMSSEVLDVDGDGRPDIFVTNIGMAARSGPSVGRDSGEAFNSQARAQSPRYSKGNQLLVNRGGGRFVDRAGALGVQNTRYVWGWAAVAADLDNDADLDLVHANNEKSSVTSEGSRTMMRFSDTAPALFENVGSATNPDFVTRRPRTVGFEQMNARGMVRIDYDRDGDVDVVAADEAGQAKLYENRGSPGNWIQVELGCSRSAATLGARVAVTAGNTTQYRFATAGADFLSQEPRALHVGLGDHRRVDRIAVRWPNGSRTVVRDVRANVRVRIYPNGTARAAPTGGMLMAGGTMENP
ncbi:MAG: CRTAC1 family protein [Haloglomus sp.]